jgi:uncharacterized protein YerC
VQAAANTGVVLIKRTVNEVELMVNGRLERYDVLQELEFTSDRKRMSVVLRNAKNAKLIMYSKGADDVMMECLKKKSSDDSDESVSLSGLTSASLATVEDEKRLVQLSNDHIEQFASSGLRTLVFAVRQSISPDAFARWKAKYALANASIDEREIKVAACYDQLELDLTIQGISAIEDKLQVHTLLTAHHTLHTLHTTHLRNTYSSSVFLARCFVLPLLPPPSLPSPPPSGPCSGHHRSVACSKHQVLDVDWRQVLHSPGDRHGLQTALRQSTWTQERAVLSRWLHGRRCRTLDSQPHSQQQDCEAEL